MAPRIAYLLKKFPRLSETFILNEMLGLERLGLSLRVISRRRSDDEPIHPQLEELEAAVEVLPAIRELDPWSYLFGQRQHRVAGRVRAVLDEWDAWPHPRRASLLTEAIHLCARAEALGIEHLHVHFASDAAVVAMLARDLGGPTYSLTAHAKDIYRDDTKLRLLDRLFRRAAFVVTVCQANVEYLSRRLDARAASRVRLLYNGIDLTRFDGVVGSAPRRDEDHVLFVGRLVEKKGGDVLLDALARLRRAGIDVRATFVGEGECRGELERQIGDLDLTDSVALTGSLDQSEVRSLMGSATAFCLPCRIGGDGNRDALPTVLIEALASGLPVVSTPVTGIPEIIGHGQAGLLVPENDAAATAEALERLLSNGVLRRRLAIAGRRRAERLFDLEQTTGTLLGWLEAVLDRGDDRCASSA